MRIDLEKTGAFVAARQAILNPEDGEGLVARAHEDVAVPGTAADVVGGIEVVVAPRLEIAAIDGDAARRIGQPPAFGLPALVGAVAEGDRDLVGGLVADAEAALGRLLGGRSRGWSLRL